MGFLFDLGLAIIWRKVLFQRICILRSQDGKQTGGDHDKQRMADRFCHTNLDWEAEEICAQHRSQCRAIVSFKSICVLFMFPVFDLDLRVVFLQLNSILVFTADDSHLDHAVTPLIVSYPPFRFVDDICFV